MAPQKNKKTDNFKPVVLSEFQAAVDSRQIAGDIGIAQATVKVRRSRLMRKMKARSLPSLSRMVDKLKLIPEEQQRS